MTTTMKTAIMALGATLAAGPILAQEMAFQPVTPEDLPADRAANVTAFQESIGADQLVALEAKGFSAYGAIAIPLAMPGAPVTMANLPSQDEAVAAVLETCKVQTGTECTVIGLLVPAGG